MINNFFKLILSKKIFFKPLKKNFLIIDKIFFKDIQKNLGVKNCNLADVRFEESNLYVLLSVFFSKEKNSFFNYIKKTIELSDPSVVITGNDNLIWFYKLKKYFPKIKFVSIQNGFRDYMFFKDLKKKDLLQCDYIFTMSKYWFKFYKSKIKTKCVSLGSFKNNEIKRSILTKRKSILFVSSGYPEKKYFEFYKKIKINALLYYKNDKKLFKNLYKYCELKNYNLEIVTRNVDDVKEFEYYKEIINNKSLVLHNKIKENIYNISDQVEVSAVSSSNFLFENLARGNKTAIFNCKKKLTNNLRNIFWNLSINNKGLFWSDEVEYKEVARVLDFTLNANKKKWKNKTDLIIKKLINYNLKNKKLFKIIKNI